jgi:hypothetical protein
MGVALFIWAYLLAVPCAVVAFFVTMLVTPRLPSPFDEGSWAEIVYRGVAFLLVGAIAFVVILVAAIMLAMWLRL